MKSFVVDEDKISTPYRIVMEQGIKREIYSDHSAILCTMNWVNRDKSSREKDRKVMTKNSYTRFRKMIEDQKVSSIWEEEEGKCDKLTKVVFEIKRKCERKVQKEKERKIIRRLMKVKRNLKKSKQRKFSETRKKLLNEDSYKEKRQEYTKKVSRAVKQFRRNGGGFEADSF